MKEISRVPLIFKNPVPWCLFLLTVLPNQQSFADIKSSVQHEIRNSVSVKGIVVDEKNEPLAGVIISVKSGKQNVITGLDGRFLITVPDKNSILIFSLLGFQKKEVQINDNTILNVTLLSDIKSLDQVLVIGFGTQKKRDLTGAVSSISEDAIKDRPIVSFEEALQGNAAGVQITSSGGQPGAASKIAIRGLTSINASNSPLIVLDGFPLSETPTNSGGGLADVSGSQSAFNAINPNDIASIEILKDASATAIYGNRGANGVILITTKKGKSGVTVINYDAYYGPHIFNKQTPVLNTVQYAAYKRLFAPNDRLFTKENGEAVDYSKVPNVNYQDEIYRQGSIQNHSLSLRGGDETTKFNASLGYLNDEAIVLNNQLLRYNGRFGLEHTLNKKLKTGIDLNYTYQNYNGVISEGREGTAAGVIQDALVYMPIRFDAATVAALTGQVDPTILQSYVNRAVGDPVNFAKASTYNTKNYNFYGNVFAEYAFKENLRFRTTLSTNFNNTKNSQFYPSSTGYGILTNGIGILGNISNTNIYNENTLTFYKTINKIHKINAVGGFTVQTNRFELFRTENTNFAVQNLGVNGISLGTTPSIPVSLVTDLSILSFLGRLNYTLLDKYLFTASLRADGSSNFINNKFGFFPSAAFAWRISDEKFMKSLKAISDLKLRLGYGQTGNQSIPSYNSYATIYNTNYSFNNQLFTGLSPQNLGNTDLSWETTTSTNVGIDAGFLNNRISFTADYYIKNTKDLLLQQPVAYTSGFSTALTNIGKMRNQGFEFSINVNLVNSSNSKWKSSLNFSTNRNKVLELGNSQFFTASANFDQVTQDQYIVKVGQPLGSMYGYKFNGVYQTDDFNLVNGTYIPKQGVAVRGVNEQPGDIKFADINGDGKINPDDRTIIGQGLPKLTGGFTNNFTFKDFDLNLLLTWSKGNSIYNANKTRLQRYDGGENQYATYLDRWTPQNASNTLYSRFPAQVSTSYFVEDGSYLRVKNIRLGYNLTSKLKKLQGLKSAKVYVSADNLITFTKYSGYDPEVSTNQTQNASTVIGLDYGAYPRSKTFLIGLNLGF